jgi:hypothetical protein
MAPKTLVRPLFAVALLAIALALSLGSVGAGARRAEGLQACTEPPNAPNLISPPNGSTIDPTDVTLRWSSVEGATQYTMELCEDSACSSPLGDFSTTNTSYSLTPLASLIPDGYCAYWRVRAENDCGNSDWSATWEVCSPAEPTPTITNTPGPSNTPTETLTPSITPTPSNTLTPSLTPTPSSTTTGRTIYGYVRDVDTDAPLADVVVTLYRGGEGDWLQISQKTTGANGYYAFSFSPVPQSYRIVESDPAGYESDHVALPSGLGTVVDANTVEFELPSESSVGPLMFYDRLSTASTVTATPMATHTGTPALSETPTETPTQTATPTPTRPSGGLTVWLPMVQKLFSH